MLREHEIELRVRYQETDAQGRVHHANYFNYFEIGRVEQLRVSGLSYREVEERGILLVVSEITCQYYLPAEYDDLVKLTTTTVHARGARIEHDYLLTRGDKTLARGHSTIACVNRQGRVQRLPDELVLED